MSTEAMKVTSTLASPAAEVRHIGLTAPFGWLADGVRSFASAPGTSLLYGALFALAAAGTTYLSWTLPGFTVAFLTGLLLIGPLLAAGLYVAARQQGNGEPVSIPAAIRHLSTRSANLGLFAIFLALIMAAWVRLSALLFAIKFNTVFISVEGYQGILSGTGDPVAVAYFVLIGLALAFTVFITSAVAIPMIVDRDCGPLHRHPDQRPRLREELAGDAGVGRPDRHPDGYRHLHVLRRHAGPVPGARLRDLAQLQGPGEVMLAGAGDRRPRRPGRDARCDPVQRPRPGFCRLGVNPTGTQPRNTAMHRFKNILYLADGPAPQRQGLDRAVALARTNQARLTVLDVTEEVSADWDPQRLYGPKLTQALVERRLSELEALTAPYEDAGVMMYTQVLTGTPFVEVIRQVQRDGHDLLIKTPRAGKGLTDQALGSSDMHLLRKCPCPVWIDRPRSAHPYRTLLAAVDPTDPHAGELNRLILDLATTLAAREQAELQVVHVWRLRGEALLRGGWAEHRRGGCRGPARRDRAGSPRGPGPGAGPVRHDGGGPEGASGQGRGRHGHQRTGRGTRCGPDPDGDPWPDRRAGALHRQHSRGCAEHAPAPPCSP